MPSVGIESIPIIVRDLGPFVRYPAGRDDLRAILARVPAGTADGLGQIELGLARYPSEGPDPDCREDTELDPFLGLFEIQSFAGVYNDEILGCYRHGDRSTIQLYGYVFDPAMRDCSIIETFLRLRMLATFVHELGHHRDHRDRVARGRWRADVSDNNEEHAEAIEHAWTLDYIIPYLEESYPDEIAALDRWLTQRVGITLPLEMLVGDPRAAEVGGEQRFFRVETAFARLFDDVQADTSPNETKVAFANELHYGTNYAEALALLDRVDSDFLPAHTLRADIYVHQDRLAEAEPLVRHVLAVAPDDLEALYVLGDILAARSDWAGVLEVASQRTNLLGIDDRWNYRTSVRREIRAAIELVALRSTGELDDVACSLLDQAERKLRELLDTTRGNLEMQDLQLLGAGLRLRQRRYADALEIIATIDASWRNRSVVRATIFEVSFCAGVPCDPEATIAILPHLRGLGLASWADRLEAIVRTLS